jgi:muramoyltetrapeptide carboxypeptidase
VELRLPPPLRPGARVAVVAPASPFAREELFRGLAWLGIRYRLALRSDLLTRTGYLAGDDARRADELAAAMRNPEVDAIVCARGGYGAMRILDALPWDALVSSPKWLVGFSDVTALHLTANANGIASVHGPNVTGLGRSITPAERLSLLDALEGRGGALAWTGLHVLWPGPPVEGPIVGGNLALVEAMAAGGRLVVPAGAMLVLEDVTERPYRIDRMLTALRLGGHLARAGAIVFGGFTQCDPGPDGVTVDDVLRDRTRDLGVPVVRGAPFGHGAPNHAFVMGLRARLDGTSLRGLG